MVKTVPKSVGVGINADALVRNVSEAVLTLSVFSGGAENGSVESGQADAKAPLVSLGARGGLATLCLGVVVLPFFVFRSRRYSAA